MLSSIHPLGERAKGNSFRLTAGAFAVGSVLGGAATGTAVALVGAALGPTGLPGSTPAVGVVAAVAAVAAWTEATGRRLPSLHRQVDEDWLQAYRGWVYGAGFGFQLGAGVLTFVTTGALYVALVAAVLVGHPVVALSIPVAFGAVRGASLLAARRIETPDRLVAVHRRLQATAPTVQRLASTTLGLLAVAATSAALWELT